MATNKWHFPLLPLDADEDSSIVGDNFKRESKGFPGIFAREFLQNTLDARERKDNGSGELQTARVSIKFLSSSDINNNYLKDALSDLEPHLRGTQTSFQPLAFEEPNILVLEEFSTTGLTGAVNNSRAQGAEERYAAFFFGEGKVSKSGKSNGRAGQGKITYNLASAARTVLVHTIREGEKTGLLFGKAIFDRTHEIGGTWYLRKSYWCLTSESEAYQPLPNEDNSAVEEFRKAFSLERNDGETGTSFVIPFVSPELTEKSLLRAILTDFFFAIHNGRLEVTINSISVNQLNLRQHVEKELHDSDDLTIDYLDFLEDAITASTASTFNASDEWASGSELLEENFGADEIDLMRDAFLDGDPIGVRFPITVTLQSGEKRESYISVFVQAGDHIRKTEECFIRTDLVIGEELHLRNFPGRVFAVTLAEDDAIAEFLADAEESSHMRFNARGSRVAELYKNVGPTLRAARQAAPRLLRLLSELENNIYEDLLVGVLSVPSTKGTKPKGTQTGKNVAKKPKKSITNPIETGPRYLSETDVSGGVKVGPGPDPLPTTLPIEAYAEFAYERTPGTGNPFKRFHPFDFDLTGPEMTEKIERKGITVTALEPNKISFTIDEPNFELKLTGFSNNQRLRVRAGVNV